MGGRKNQNKSGSGWTDAGAPALLPDSSVQIKMTGGLSGVEEKKNCLWYWCRTRAMSGSHEGWGWSVGVSTTYGMAAPYTLMLAA